MRWQTVEPIPAAKRRNLWTVLLAALLALVLITINEVSYRESDTALENLGRRGEARVWIQTLWRSVVDAETGQRGYLLTGNREFLQPYEHALKSIEASSNWLAEYYRGDPTAQSLVADLDTQIKANEVELSSSISHFDQSDHQTRKALIPTGVGSGRTATIRTLSEGLLTIESNRVSGERQYVFETLSRTRILINVLTGSSLLAVLMFLRQVNLAEHLQHRLSDELELERDQLEHEVKRRTVELTELAKHLQTAREDERGRLSRELHDELGALLTAAKLDIARLKRAIGVMSPEIENRIAHLHDTVNQGIALKRNIIENLRPSSLSNLGLVAALEIQAGEFTDRTGIRVQADLSPVPLSDSGQITVYRLVQESLTNIAKHATATEVSVRLHSANDKVNVEVADNGRGFDQRTAMAGTHGLKGMRFRVETEGGKMQIESRPNGGTKVVAWIPATASSTTSETNPTTPTPANQPIRTTMTS